MPTPARSTRRTDTEVAQPGSSYTIVYGTLDRLPTDGPGLYNREPDPACKHPLGKRWWIYGGDVLNERGDLTAPVVVVCLDCGCGVPAIGANARTVPSRDECERLMHAEFLRHWYERDMSPATVATTLRYLFGARAFPRPANHYRGRSCPDRRLAKLRGQPRQTPVALCSAREMRARGEIAAFPRDLRRLNAVMPYRVHAEDGGYWTIRREFRAAWMVALSEGK